MTKVKKVGRRGTVSYVSDYEKLNWAGDDYRAYQQKKIKGIDPNATVHVGRGTKTLKRKDIPEPNPRRSTAGMTRVTNRGTSKRRSRNTGSGQET